MRLDNRIFFDEVARQLATGREVEIRMKGHSMRPLLRDGRDVAVLAPCRGEEVRHGDVVLFRSGGRYILHRVLRREGGILTLAGDGNYRVREQCMTDDVAGRLVRVLRPSGRCLMCEGLRWRCQSRVWLALPAIFRRYTLALLWRLGVR